MKKSFLLFLAILPAFIHCGNPEKEKQTNALAGTWDFETFELPEKASEESRSSLKDLISSYQGQGYTFTSDGKCKGFHKNGPPENNFNGEYRYYPEKRNLIIDVGGDIYPLTILQLNKSTLKMLHRKESITIILKKRAN